MDDHLVHEVLVGVVERRHTEYQLVYQDPEPPPVVACVVAGADYHLWGEVFLCPAEGVCRLLALYELRHAVIGQTDVALVVYEDILRLHVPVDDPVLVEMSECQRDLCCVEAGLVLGEAPGTAEVLEELAALLESHYEEELFRSLEGLRGSEDEEALAYIIKADEEWVLRPGEHFPLSDCVCDLIFINNVLLT